MVANLQIYNHPFQWTQKDAMNKISIPEDTLSTIINNHCLCGGRGPAENPCPACSVWHDIIKYDTQQGDSADEIRNRICPGCGKEIFRKGTCLECVGNGGLRS